MNKTVRFIKDFSSKKVGDVSIYSNDISKMLVFDLKVAEYFTPQEEKKKRGRPKKNGGPRMENPPELPKKVTE